MWDRHDILNGIASALFAAAFVTVAYAAVHYAMRLPAFALREVRITNELVHVTPDQIDAVVAGSLHGNFFTLDLEQARAGFEKLPWVRRVNVRRQWPDRLEVALEEHVPLGRWGNAGLVNTHGEPFAAAYDGKLPSFVGPPGSEREIAMRYGYFRRSLAALGLEPVAVQVSARRAWQVRVANGLTIEVGREQVESRLDRFVAVYGRTVAPLARSLDYVDLRYPNGFAVRVPGLEHAREGAPGERRRARANG